MLIFVKILIGALVGSLVGLTGVGGGVLLLPILIFGLGVPPLVAVGSDAAFNSITKIGAGFLHWRQGNVRWKLVGALSLGSLTGALIGVAILAHLRAVYGPQLNNMLRIFLGILLVCIPVLLYFQGRLEKYFAAPGGAPPEPMLRLVLIGLFSGLLVGASSVGSGSVIMLLLLIFVRSSPATLVGTDIIHAVLLTGVAGLAHMRLGNVDAGVVLPLLIGSIPGSLLGVRLANVLPGRWLRAVLCIVLLASGARMLWV